MTRQQILSLNLRQQVEEGILWWTQNSGKKKPEGKGMGRRKLAAEAAKVAVAGILARVLVFVQLPETNTQTPQGSWQLALPR